MTSVARDLLPGDWEGVAVLLGQEREYGARLARHVETTYRPWFGWVVPSEAPESPCAAVVAGVRRRTSDGSPAAVQVSWIGVTPDQRRNGIGRHLLDRVIASAARLGARRVEVTVDAGDERAVGFLRAAGFEPERRTMEVRVDAPAGASLVTAPPPAGVVIRPLRHDELPALAGLLIHLAVERATEPHDDLDGLTPSVLAGASMHADHVGAGAWEADDPTAAVGVAWGARLAGGEGVRVRFVGVHEDARRRGTGRALLGALLARARIPTLLARVHEPAPVHGFLAAIGAVVRGETFDMVRPVGDADGGTLDP